jgi:hypothetical protein
MYWIRCALISLFALSVLTADTIVSVHGDPIETGGPTLASFQDLVASWTATTSYSDVSIDVNLLGTPGTYSGTAYLTETIGPGTTLSDQIVEEPFTANLTSFPFQSSISLFQGLTLGPGTFYLTLSSGADPNAGFAWITATHDQSIATGPGVTRNEDLTSFGNSQASFAPASVFSPLPFDGPSPLSFSVTGTSTPVPEPKDVFIVGVALLGLYLKTRM